MTIPDNKKEGIQPVKKIKIKLPIDKSQFDEESYNKALIKFKATHRPYPMFIPMHPYDYISLVDFFTIRPNDIIGKIISINENDIEFGLMIEYDESIVNDYVLCPRCIVMKDNETKKVVNKIISFDLIKRENK